MYERRIIPCGEFAKVQLIEVCRYVLVNKFTEESLKQFIEDCSKIINLGQKFLPIVIDSFGGYVYSLLGMVDFLDSCDIDVITICEGKAMSCGSLLMSCGSVRYIGANSTVMIHDVSSMLWGKDIDLQNDAKEVSRLNRKVYSILDKNTNQKAGYWRALVKENKYADLFMTPPKAIKHNLATEIGIPHIETVVSVTTELIV